MTQSTLKVWDQVPLPVRTQLVDSVARLRMAWEEAAEETSLLDLYCPVGLILFDISEQLGLNPDERRTLLGVKLSAKVDEYIAAQPIEQ